MFEAFFNQSHIPLAILSGKDFMFKYVNAAYRKLMNDRELVGLALLDAIPELEGQRFSDVLREVFETGKSAQISEIPATAIFSGTEQSTRYFNMSYVPHRDEDGSVDSIIAMGDDVTEQVLLRKGILNSGIEYHAYQLLMQAPVAIAIIRGGNHVIELANSEVLKIWRKSTDIVGKPLLEAMPEIRNTAFPSLLDKVMSTATSHHEKESSAVFVHGGREHLVYFNFVYQPYYDSDSDRPSGVIVIANEVTDQVNARKVAEESEMRLMSVLSETPVATAILTGREMKIEMFNESMLKIWRRNADVLGKPLMECIPELLGQSFPKILDDVYTSGKTYVAKEELAYFNVDGELVPGYFNYTYTAMRNVGGDIYGILVIANDVTEQVVARQNIEHAEEQARLAIESANLGVYELDLPGNEMKSNDRLKELFGFDKNVAVNRAEFVNAIHPDDLAERKRAHHLSIETGNLHYEARIIKPDKNIQWIKVNGTVLFDDEGKPIKLLGVIQDITDQKVFEEELEKQILERTKQLSIVNKALEKSIDELTMSNSNLEDFAYAASHDLKEPIRKIQVFADRFRLRVNSKLEPDERQLLERMQYSTSRMGTLVDDLLEYSHVSQGTKATESIDLNKKLQEIMNDLELPIHEKNASISIESLPTITGNRRQIQQLFHNLISNALKYNKMGESPVIRISYELVNENNTSEDIPVPTRNQPYHLIRVEDNGIGFDQVHADRIFQVFQRLHGKGDYEGTGVGLAIARKVVQNHKGFIWAEGRVGLGAKFSVLLPL